ncbi:MAG: type II secretion system protein [Patescibacteria group bacterium]
MIKSLNSKSYILNSRDANAFTLIELLVAMGIFVIVISIVSASFIQALRTQRSISALMEANDNTSLVLEQMAREIRTGYRFCTASAPILNLDPIYIGHCDSLAADEMAFINAHNEEVSYRFESEAIWKKKSILGVSEDKKITADNIKVNNFKIILVGNDSGDSLQPKITVSLSISPKDERDVKGVSTDIQTTISPRLIINP